MSHLPSLLAQHELLALFVVISTGLLLGHLRVGKVQIGVTGVLFSGLGLSAWTQMSGSQLSLVPSLKEVGLILFVYCVGLSSGPGFFGSLRDRGLRLNGAVAIGLVSGACTALIGGRLLGIEGEVIVGIFCGALTNTPALGAATDVLKGSGREIGAVLGYSLTYPFGVMGALLSFRLFTSSKKRLLAEEIARAAPSVHSSIVSSTVVIENAALMGRSIGELEIYSNQQVIVSRMKRNGEVVVPTKYTTFHAGDLATIVGTHDAVEVAIPFFGKRSPIHLEADREKVDMRRILVSDPKLAGRRLVDLHLDRRFNAQVTRLRRADLDLVPSPDLELTLGDRLRIVAPKNRLTEVAQFFGDSERELADVDFVALALGITAGLVLGLLPFSVLGTSVALGAAGGPLLVALVLGRIGRAGPLNFLLPFEVNQTLRKLGLLFFLAGVGMSAGGALTSVIGTEALTIVALGGFVTLLAAFVTLGLAATWGGATVIGSLGVTSGMQTQPATLAAAFELGGRSEEVYVSYALVYPLAMIGKIAVAQLFAALG